MNCSCQRGGACTLRASSLSTISLSRSASLIIHLSSSVQGCKMLMSQSAQRQHPYRVISLTKRLISSSDRCFVGAREYTLLRLLRLLLSSGWFYNSSKRRKLRKEKITSTHYLPQSLLLLWLWIRSQNIGFERTLPMVTDMMDSNHRWFSLLFTLKIEEQPLVSWKGRCCSLLCLR